MFICGMSARGRTEFYQPIVEHFCSIPDDTDPSKKLLTCVLLTMTLPNSYASRLSFQLLKESQAAAAAAAECMTRETNTTLLT